MPTTRRGFLKILGLAPLLPLAAKLPGSAPAPFVATNGLTLEKLIAAKRLLDAQPYPERGVKYPALDPRYLTEYAHNWEEIASYFMPPRTAGRTWKGRRLST